MCYGNITCGAGGAMTARGSQRAAFNDLRNRKVPFHHLLLLVRHLGMPPAHTIRPLLHAASTSAGINGSEQCTSPPPAADNTPLLPPREPPAPTALAPAPPTSTVRLPISSSRHHRRRGPQLVASVLTSANTRSCVHDDLVFVAGQASRHRQSCCFDDGPAAAAYRCLWY